MHITTKMSSYNYSSQTKMINNINTVGKKLDKNEGLKTNSYLHQDKLTISSYALKMNKNSKLCSETNKILEGMLEKKENLVKLKNDIISNMLEQEQNPQDVQEKIKEIDKQLKSIEEEIRKVQFEEQQKNMAINKETINDKTDSTIDNKNDNTKSQDELSATANKLISSSNDLNKLKDASTIQTKLEGESRVLKKEIELDEARSLNGKASAAKYEKYDKLQKSLADLTTNIAEKSADLASESAKNDLNTKDIRLENNDDQVDKDNNDKNDKKYIDTIQENTRDEETKNFM